MSETQAKYHHLIPQTYMSAWANQSGTLNVEFLNEPGTIVRRNKEKIAGITDYHSIKAGMPLCTQKDTDKIFAVLSDYNVKIGELTISNTMDMNRYFYDFDNWTISRNDGTLVSKKSIKREIEKVKIKDIEMNWSVKYEDKWDSIVKEIETNILTASSNCIPQFQKDFLMKFFVAINWRGFQSNQQFEDVYNRLTKDLLCEIEIPYEERDLPCLETAFEEIRHDILLSFYRLFLDEKGVIYKQAELNKQHSNFHFLVSDGPTFFDTSDSPSFIFQRSDGAYQGIMPVTPRILLAQGKCTEEDADVYYITHITDKAVQKYNTIIREHSLEFVIHPY